MVSERTNSVFIQQDLEEIEKTLVLFNFSAVKSNIIFSKYLGCTALSIYKEDLKRECVPH